MEKETIRRLRVLVTDGPGVRLDEVTRTVAGLGHEVVARESSLLEVAHITAAEHPDVALLIVHEGNTKGLQMIDRIVHESACPVIAVIDVEDREFVPGSEDASRHPLTHAAETNEADLHAEPLKFTYASWPLTHSSSRVTYSTMSPVLR